MTRGRGGRSDPRAVQADRVVEQTLHEVVHEIRQPLAAIFALADVARRSPGVPAEVRGYLALIIEQASEVSAAAWSVLEGPTTGAASDGSEAVDVGDVVASVLQGFALSWGGTFTCSGDLDGVSVLGDRATVRRCLVNIVDNAVRAAGPHGKVTVTVRRGAGMLRILVEDDGPGFGNVPTGTGLGIELTRKALEAMGGALSVGAPGSLGGAAVTLFLRVPRADSTHVDEAARAG
jgi:signal transduction histidine kinase